MKILFFIGSVFPYGAAWSSRGRNLAKLFTLSGHQVHIIAHYTYEHNYIPREIVHFEGITYQAISNQSDRFDKLYSPILDINTIKNYIANNKIDLFVTTSIPQIYSPILKYLKKRKIPLYLEQCEWFDSSTFKFGKFNPYYRAIVRNIEQYYEKSDGIIAISSFEKYYSNKGVKVIRIPTILDVSEIEYKENPIKSDGTLRLVLAGNIGGKKELLYPIIKAIDILKEECKIEFNIFGSSKKEVLININHDAILLENLKNSVIIHGKIPQQEVNKHLSSADFMIFIRPNRRSSNAGFPTKFAESLAVGTPVITNITSDIGEYLIDGRNGYRIDEVSPENISSILKKIFALSDRERHDMRRYARETAERYFDYKSYVNVIKYFLK